MNGQKSLNVPHQFMELLDMIYESVMIIYIMCYNWLSQYIQSIFLTL